MSRLLPPSRPQRRPSPGAWWRILVRVAALMALTAPMAWGPARAQSDELATQRERIARERAEARALYAEREYACSQRFAVTGCIEKARKARSEVLDALKREEEVLDSGERRRRAAERLESIRQKTEAQARPRPAAAAASAASGAENGRLPRIGRATRPDGGGGKAVPGAAGVVTPGATARPGEAATPGAAASAGARDDGRLPVRRTSPGREPSAPDAESAAQRAAGTRERQGRAAEREAARASAPAASRPAAAPLPPRPAIPPPPPASGAAR